MNILRTVSYSPSDVVMRAFVDVLGEANVRVGDAGITHGDPYAYFDQNRFRPGAALLPDSVEELQAILAIAREHRVPLWSVSTGKNLGYGGAAPRVSGSVVVDLQRMNRILEVNEEMGYAVVEPGVRFLDLYEYLRDRGSRLMMSVPDIGWGSLVGNALERGFGYTAGWDHSAQRCGLEFVMADGRIVRTGMGAKTDNSAWHLYKGGFGPSIEGLMQQSNFGIVTRMGVWLMPTPQTVTACMIKAPRDADVGPLVEVLRPLLIDGTIQSNVVIGNTTVIASMISDRPTWWSSEEPIADHAVQAAADALGLGRWNARFGLYGASTMVDARIDLVRSMLRRIDGADLIVHRYPGDVKASEVNPADHAQLGIPGTALVRMAAWRGGTPAHTDFSLVCPATLEDVERQREIIQTEVEAHGFDYAGGFTLCGRHAIALALLSFDRSNAQQRGKVETLFGRLIDKSSEAGYVPYRGHPAFMDKISDQYDFNDHSFRAFTQTLKDALDPLGILSAGKQGIWPGTQI